jgi:2-polyprenyl-3-methyl-5-hydroxy-6-metoxy-1,4-benzoquinol methylase
LDPATPYSHEKSKGFKVAMLSIKKIRKNILYKISPSYRSLLRSLDLGNDLNRKLDIINQKIDVLEVLDQKIGAAINGNQNIIDQNKEIKKILEALSEKNLPKPDDRFGGHYYAWRQKRIDCFIKHYGMTWFQGKTILELGCGYADIGNVFHCLGADVTVSDARAEHIDIVRERYPHLKTLVHDCEKKLPFGEDQKFDLIIHTGMLYHIDKYEDHLADCLKNCHNMILETEVCDSDDENFHLYVEEDSSFYDKSFSKRSYRPSPNRLEKIIKDNGGTFEKLTDESCDIHFHSYSWPMTNTKEWRHGLRALWFIRVL